MGRIVAFSKWDELTLGTNCRFLEFGTNCHLGRIVAWDELSPNQMSGFPVFEAMVPLPRSMASSLLALPRSCHDLAMILARIPWPCKIVQRLTMINHDLGKGSMVPLAKIQSSYFQIVTSI